MTEKPNRAEMISELEGQLADLRRQLDELTSALPRHSIKPTHLMQIDDLEEQIGVLEAELSALLANL